ncbi:hypothetical protein CCP4SC76_2780001 [Gammaproteobacteria bacterium]
MSLFEVFNDNLMLGYPPPAGQFALNKWLKMVEKGSPLPHAPDQAEELITSGKARFRPVEKIAVDMASRWKEIVRVDYADNT